MRGSLLLFALVVSLPATAWAQGSEDADPETVGGGASLGAPSDDADDADRALADDELPDDELASDATLPRPALLDHRFGQARDGRSERIQAWASMGVFGGSLRFATPLTSLATRVDSSDAIVIAPSIGARLALTRELDISLEWNAAYGVETVRGAFLPEMTEPEPYEAQREVFEPGNPVLRLAYTHDWSILSLQVGAAAAIPVAALAQAANSVPTAIDRAASLMLHELVLAMHGAVDVWRFLPERLSVLVPVRMAVGDRLGGAVEVVGGFTVPVLGSQRDSQVEGVLQIAGDVSYEIVPELRIGARGSVAVWRLGRPDGSARAQGALEPWIRATFGPGFVLARATLDLGGDYGLGTGAGVWAIHVGGGASLDAAP